MKKGCFIKNIGIAKKFHHKKPKEAEATVPFSLLYYTLLNYCERFQECIESRFSGVLLFMLVLLFFRSFLHHWFWNILFIEFFLYRSFGRYKILFFKKTGEFAPVAKRKIHRPNTQIIHASWWRLKLRVIFILKRGI